MQGPHAPAFTQYDVSRRSATLCVCGGVVASLLRLRLGLARRRGLRDGRRDRGDKGKVVAGDEVRQACDERAIAGGVVIELEERDGE